MAQPVKPADVGVAVGTVFLGKYRVDSILGHGGMGIVAECMHLALNERRAIKMLRQDVLMDHDAVQRFVREAQAAVKLKSEYVAKVHDVGTFETGVPYMEMEFLEGLDLGQLLEERGVVSVPWGCEMMLQTCEALAEAHSLGIVHRDIKPTNLFVTWRPDGSPTIKVLDFGISKSPMGTDMHLTQTQSLLGTPAYMSPEQMRSARLVDQRTDIWSLGTVLYEILENRKPFEAGSFSEMCVKVAVDQPEPMINTPPALQQVILRCLAKAPEQRYANMAELAHDLVPYVKDKHQAELLVERMTRMLRRSQSTDFSGDTNSSVRIPRKLQDAASGPARAPSPPVHYVPPQQEGSHGYAQTLRTPRRSRWPLLVIGVLIAGAVGTALVLSTSGEDTTQPQEPHVIAPPPTLQPPATEPSKTEPAKAAVEASDGSGSGSGGAKADDSKPAVVEGKPVTGDGKPVTGDGKAPIHHPPVTTSTRGSGKASGTTGKINKAASGAGAGSGSGSGATPATSPSTGTGSGSGSGSGHCDPFDAMHRC